MQYPSAHSGVKKLFIAEIISIVGGVLGLVAAIISTVFVNAAADAPGLIAAGSVLLVTGFIMVVAFILQMIGLLQAGKDEPNFRSGFWIAIFGIVISLVAAILRSITGVPELLCSILESLSSVASIVVLIFTLSGVANLASALGDNDMFEKGRALINWITILFVVSIVLGLFPSFFANPNEGIKIMLSVMAIVAALVELVIYINILIYLYKAIKMLKK